MRGIGTRLPPVHPCECTPEIFQAKCLGVIRGDAHAVDHGVFSIHIHTRVYEHTGASVRGNAPSYFLTIASRSPREARTYSLVHHDTRDTGRSALHRMWGLSGMNFLLILQLIFFVGKNSVAGSLLVFECEATDIHE